MICLICGPKLLCDVDEDDDPVGPGQRLRKRIGRVQRLDPGKKLLGPDAARVVDLDRRDLAVLGQLDRIDGDVDVRRLELAVPHREPMLFDCPATSLS